MGSLAGRGRASGLRVKAKRAMIVDGIGLGVVYRWSERSP